MKVTRLRSGYSIRLSDSDFELLTAFAADGESRTIFESDSERALREHGHSPAVQSAYTRRVKGGDYLRVDEDRRHAK